MKNTKITPTAAFALNILRKEMAAKPGKNVMVSPISISLAVGMAANGARSKTLEGMLQALGIKSNMKTNNKGYAALLEMLKRAGIGVTVETANAIFSRSGISFEPEFLYTNEKFFNACVTELNFNDPATIDTINGYVSNATNKKIDKLIEEIGPDTVMFLINCAYFKGEWTKKFDKAETQNRPFAGVGDVPTMYRCETMWYGKDTHWDTYQVVSLPFGESKDMRMLVILPNEGKTFDDLFARLTEEALIQHAQNEYEWEGTLWLPRIDVQYENSLKDSLKALGMEDAFGDADFTGMHAKGGLYISDVKHKTVFKVDEEGAEGAAATVVEMVFECAGPMPFEMDINRPFITFVIDSKSHAVLFAGHVSNPTK